jgi:hypothetical protein
MPDVTLTEHKWVIAANVPVDTRSARKAMRRGNVRIPVETKVDALDVYCDGCRRPFDEVVGKKCEISPVLHGGPIGTRKKRGPQEEPVGLVTAG